MLFQFVIFVYFLCFLILCAGAVVSAVFDVHRLCCLFKAAVFVSVFHFVNELIIGRPLRYALAIGFAWPLHDFASPVFSYFFSLPRPALHCICFLAKFHATRCICVQFFVALASIRTLT